LIPPLLLGPCTCGSPLFQLIIQVPVLNFVTVPIIFCSMNVHAINQIFFSTVNGHCCAVCTPGCNSLGAGMNHACSKSTPIGSYSAISYSFHYVFLLMDLKSVACLFFIYWIKLNRLPNRNGLLNRTPYCHSVFQQLLSVPKPFELSTCNFFADHRFCSYCFRLLPLQLYHCISVSFNSP
jgi:hypothetical protein